VFGLIAFCASAHAATTGTPPSVYDIEVVVFENRLADLEGGEMWPTENVQELVADIGTAVEADAPAEDSNLSAAVHTLKQDPSYRVLAHRRWTQNAEARSATKPVHLRSPDAALDGVLRFYLSRFLHLDMSLVLVEGQGDWKTGTDFNGQIYRLTEHRRVKTQEINYFDHPKLGVLVRVVQVGKP
jgi:hypothetical protein